MHGATTTSMTPYMVQQQCLRHHAWHDDWQLQHQSCYNDSAYNIMCSMMMAAPTPLQHNNSAYDTTWGATVATTTPNVALHALDL